MAILDPGLNLTLRPMQYPQFYEYFKLAQQNNWTMEEISFSTDVADLRDKLTPAEHHVISRLVAFFATGDNIVADNVVINLYKHVNSPEVRMYYGRQLFEECLHIQAYLTLLDEYIPDAEERAAAFDAINEIPSIKQKADFAFKWMDGSGDIEELKTDEDRRLFLMNIITFAAAIEGLFFFGAFVYVYFLRSRGLLNGLADVTNWVFRDESFHMNVAFEVVDIIRKEYPTLWDDDFEQDVINMLQDAIDCEFQFAQDALSLGIGGLTESDMLDYLKFTADEHLARLGIPKHFGGKNNFDFMELQNLEGHSNFFERTVSAYAVNVSGDVPDEFGEDF